MTTQPSDPESAKRFYATYSAGRRRTCPRDGGIYSMCRRRGQDVAAIFEQQGDEKRHGIPPHWNNYVTVDDIETADVNVAEDHGPVID